WIAHTLGPSSFRDKSTIMERSLREEEEGHITLIRRQYQRDRCGAIAFGSSCYYAIRSNFERVEGERSGPSLRRYLTVDGSAILSLARSLGTQPGRPYTALHPARLALRSCGGNNPLRSNEIAVTPPT